MHKSASHDPDGKRVVCQAQADSCCATVQRNHSATAASSFVLFGPLVLGGPIEQQVDWVWTAIEPQEIGTRGRPTSQAGYRNAH